MVESCVNGQVYSCAHAPGMHNRIDYMITCMHTASLAFKRPHARTHPMTTLVISHAHAVVDYCKT